MSSYIPDSRQLARLNRILAFYFWREGWHGGFW